MSIENVKQEVQALVNAKFGANAPMLWNVYNSNPGSDTVEYWENMRQSLTAQPVAAQETGAQGSSAPSPAASGKQSDEWIYEAAEGSPDSAGGIVITGYKGKGDELHIPAEIDGKTVVRIGKSAFEKASFSVVTIPEGVTEICQEAFYKMEFLRHVDIPDSVVTIGDEAFQSCGLKTVRLEKGGVKTIGKDAFRNNNIEELSLPGGLETIGDQAFAKNKIKSLQIPDSVNSIGVEAFSGNDMENLILGLGLTVIGPKAFRNNKIKTIIIPDTVKEVCEEAFWQNNIEYAVIPDAGLTIGEKAFGKVKPIKVSEYNAKVASGKIKPPEQKPSQKPAPKSSSNLPGGNVAASDADGFPIR
ncbi:MAG: leucine-rich repeat domain-containing protein, partial [Treponema sp.]|nr:leucine-rich repeat domain-containing protein [Treponema sp.]